MKMICSILLMLVLAGKTMQHFNMHYDLIMANQITEQCDKDKESKDNKEDKKDNSDFFCNRPSLHISNDTATLIHAANFSISLTHPHTTVVLQPPENFQL